MKQISKISLLTVLIIALSIAGNKRDKEKIEENFLIGATQSYAPSEVSATTSPWLPLNFDNANSQYRLIEYVNGSLWFAGGPTAAPMLGNYRGFVSKDSGKTWKKFSMPVRQSSATSTSMRFANVTAANESVAVLADYYGFIMRTENAGTSWDTVALAYGSGAFYNGIKFVNSTTAIAMGDKIDSTIYVGRSTDGGKTWARVNVPNDANSKMYDYGNGGAGIITASGNNVWLTAYDNDSEVNHPGVYKSTDAGATWTLNRATNLETSKRWYFRNISFKDANVGYAVSSGTGHVGRLHKSTDGGVTWSDTINIESGVDRLNQQVIGVQALPGTSHVIALGFSAATGSKSWWSTDDGATWTVLNTPGNTATNLNSAAFITPTLGFAVGTRNVLSYTPTVELTFTVNTSTVPDTLKGTSTVQMRGDDGNLLKWDGGSAVRFANIGGDYWQAKARFVPGKAFPYKIFTNVNPNVGPGHAQEHTGWEGNLQPTNDRQMTVGQNDSTIMLQFVNGSPGAQPYFWRPYVEGDSLEVTFRVNMANQEDFNPANMVVGVRGGAAPLEWGKSFILKRETNDGNNPTRYPGGNFWSGTMKFPYTKAMTDTLSAPRRVEYKFVQMAASAAPTADPLKWEDNIVAAPDVAGNRFFDIKKGQQDTTLYWKWWANVGAVPPAGSDTAIVKFRVDMTRAIQTQGYVVGDTVQVRYGFANSAKVIGTKNLVKEGLTFFYSATDSMITGVKVQADGLGKPLVYQYYLVKNGQDYREVYYNFAYSGSDVTLAERRLLPLKAKSNTVQDTSKNLANAARWPFWRNTRKLTQNVDVKFTVNLQPAWYQVSQGAVGKDTLYDIQGPWTIHKGLRDSIFKWGVSINGPATGGWAAWGTALYNDATRKMYDDGTNGDALAKDHIYTRVIKFYKDSINNVVGQEFKFGIHGGDNEGGKGGFGNNHIENINDAAATATIHSQFGSINPLYYDRWNFTTEKALTPDPLVGVSQSDATVPTVYSLEQNFPNPFNPSTTINYAIPYNGLVTLKIYNVLGQEVATLVNQEQLAGNYTATFNASALSSGVYLYKIEAGNYTSVKKMMLLK